MTSIERTVKEIVIDILLVDADEVVPSASFALDLGADSLDVVHLVMAFEEAFEIDIPEEDSERITTVQQAIEYIRKAKGAVTQ